MVISEGIDIDQHEANITSEKPQLATIFDLKADLQSVKVLFFTETKNVKFIVYTVQFSNFWQIK